MKQYNNGPRKTMSYGGMPMRKPMMKGGKVKKMQAGGKAKKKASPIMPATPMTAASQRTPMAMGGMSATQQQQNMQQNMTSGQMNQMQTDMMQSPKLRMSKGGEAFGMLSVKAGIDNNPKPTQADRIAGATKNKR
jgi:hypothetical protein